LGLSAKVGYLVDRTLSLEKPYNFLGGLSPHMSLVVASNLAASSLPKVVTVSALMVVVAAKQTVA
jgi:hypothetical protein